MKRTVQMLTLTEREVDFPDCFEPDEEAIARNLPDFAEFCGFEVPADHQVWAITVLEGGDPSPVL